MKYIIQSRGTGKTKRLIELCAANPNGIIICAWAPEAAMIAKMAKDMGLEIPHPVAIESVESLQGTQYTDAYYDNVELILLRMTGMEGKMMTMSIE